MRELLAQWLPLLDAILIALSGVFLVRGLLFIRRRDIQRHHRSMLTATLFAALFLIVYVIRYFMFEPRIFAGEGAVRVIYLVILISHTILATLLGPLVLVVLYFALKGRFDRHRRLARIAAPIWGYVVVTGWIIYLMLHLA
jgi:putative membrane protein